MNDAKVSVSWLCRDCLFYGFTMAGPGEEARLKITYARGVAFCPTDKIAEMAASELTIWAFIKAKWRWWRTSAAGNGGEG